MTRGARGDAGRRARRTGWTRPSFEVTESKLHPPVIRPGIVVRPELVDRLIAAQHGGLVAVVAPPGYGKTTLLAQWAERTPTRVAWVSVDSRDNDPAVLLTYLAVALDRVEPIRPAAFRVLASPVAGVAVVPALVSAIAAMRQPVTVVLDHTEAITQAECQDVILELALSMPPGSQLAIASRDSLRLSAARLRAQGGIVEIGAEDLALGEAEAAYLLKEAGIDLAESDVRSLVERTEGWPAGLYLAVLAMKAGSTYEEAAFSIAGDDRYVGDYLRAEFLDRVSRSDVSFLTRTSILERMCGPLCDATVDRQGSARKLEQLESRNLLVVPLDRRRTWFRYHQLFRELLYAELTRREPETIVELHERAAAWYEENAMSEQAIEHAQAAGDAGRVVRLVLNVMQPVWASGRVDTVLRWMEWLEGKDGVEHYSAVAAHAALTLALLGQPGATERWAGAAERAPSSGLLPDGNTAEATLAYLRALLCRQGVVEMRRDAQLALEGLSPASPYRATMLHAEGLSYLLEGEGDRADPIFAHAYDVAADAGVVPFMPLVLAERGLLAIDRDDWPAAEALAERALAIVRGGEFDHYWTSALVYAWAGRVAARRGDVVEARVLAARAARLRPLLTYALPVVSAQTLVELASCYVALGDAGGARAVLLQAQDIFHQRPELGLLPAKAGELRGRLDMSAARPLGASSLTAAELRILPLLSTHLSLGEIGERLYLSRNTVKTHAIAVYRKLGVSSRSEAVMRTNELGLLPMASVPSDPSVT